MAINRVPFNDLQVTTKTIIIYSNLEIDLDRFYNEVDVYDISKESVPLTKKLQMPDIKKIRAPYKKIWSIRNHKSLTCRGVDTKPSLVKIRELREKNRVGALNEKDMNTLENMDIKQNILHFKNQLCCYMSFTEPNGEILNINIMIFKRCFKIVGCKKDKYSYEIVRTLWNYLRKLKCYFITDSQPPTFIFDFVMNNYGFYLNLRIHKNNMNRLMNSSEFRNKPIESHYDSAGNTNIKITFPTNVPTDFKYLAYVCSPTTSKIKEKYVKLNPYKRDKSSNKKNQITTILLYNTSKGHVSGRFSKEMENVYNHFLDIVSRNIDTIEEKLVE